MRAIAGLLIAAGLAAIPYAACAQSSVDADQGWQGRQALFAAAFDHGHGQTPDSIRLSVLASIPLTPSAVDRTSGAGPSISSLADQRTVDLGRRQAWPSPLSLSAGGYDIGLTPHASVASANGIQSAEAGAMVTVGPDIQGRVLSGMNRLGLRTVNSDSFRDRGRWYLFAAASGTSVGLNMARDSGGGFRRVGWSADDGGTTMISDAQAGVAWRKGNTQASIGYVHREIHGDYAANNINPNKFSDSMVALSFSIHGR